jgi:hypothetical protein
LALHGFHLGGMIYFVYIILHPHAQNFGHRPNDTVAHVITITIIIIIIVDMTIKS